MYWEVPEARAWLAPARTGSRAAGQREPRAPRPAEEIEADSVRRTKGDVRRWCAANEITHLGTLTNADQVRSRAEISRRVRRFLEAMHADGWHLPICLIAEAHPGGHGFHVHFGAPRFIPIDRLRAWWPHGRIDIRTRTERRAIGRGKGGIPGYLAKYIGKQLDAEELHGCEPRPAFAKRWWHTHGTDPTRTVHEVVSLEAVERFLKRHLGDWAERKQFRPRGEFQPEGYCFYFPHARARPPPAWALAPRTRAA